MPRWSLLSRCVAAFLIGAALAGPVAAQPTINPATVPPPSVPTGSTTAPSSLAPGGCFYSASPPTDNEGQRDELSCTLARQLRTSTVITSIADGVNVTQGALADAAATDSTSSWSIDALLKGIYRQIGSPVQANAITLGAGTPDNKTTRVTAADAADFVTAAGLPTGSIAGSPTTAAQGVATAVTLNALGQNLVVDTTGFNSVGLQAKAAASSSITIDYAVSDDGLTWNSMSCWSDGNNGQFSYRPVINSMTQAQFVCPAGHHFSRVGVQAATSGSIMLWGSLKTAAAPLQTLGNTPVSFQGNQPVQLQTGSNNIGALTAGSANIGSTTGYSGWLESSAPLAASGAYTLTSATARGSTIWADYAQCQAYADQAGTLTLNLAVDGTNYYPISTAAVTAGTTATARGSLSGVVGTAAFKCTYANGTSAQTVFRLSSSLTAH